MLRTFKYSFADPADVRLAKVPQSDPFTIRGGLMSHSATTLRKMALLFRPNDIASVFHIREFSALTELRTTYTCLIEGGCSYHPLGSKMPGSVRRLVLDGQKHSMSNAQTSLCSCDPVAAVLKCGRCQGRAGHCSNRTVEELVFTGYKGFADESDKEHWPKMTMDVSLVVRFSAIEELDWIFSVSSR